MEVLNPGSLTDHDGLSSSDSLSLIMEIQKAFEAGHDYDMASLTGGQAGRVQSLEGTFKVITFEERAAAFWQKCPKQKVTSTVLEWSRINEVAGMVFYPEGGDVDETNDVMDRKFDIVKFAGVKGSVTFGAKSVKMIQAAEITETKNKTRSMVRSLDLALWNANSAINAYEFDGVITQVKANMKNPAQGILDKRGSRITDADILNATTCIKSNYGYGELRLWMSLDAVNGYVQEKILNKMYYTNAGGTKDLSPTDQDFSSFRVANGSGKVEEDVFMRAESAVLNRILTSTYAAFQKNHVIGPDAPTAVITAETSDGTYSLANGSYKYAVVPENQYGEGLAYECSITHSGGSKMTKLVITRAGTGDLATGYKVYRCAGTSTDKRDFYLVERFVSGGATTTWYDKNDHIPGTTTAVMMEWNADQTFVVSQLADMMKLPYGIRSDKKEWLQKVYLVPQVFNPNRFYIFENVGMLANS